MKKKEKKNTLQLYWHQWVESNKLDYDVYTYYTAEIKIDSDLRRTWFKF